MSKSWKARFFMSSLVISGILIAPSNSTLAYQLPVNRGGLPNTRIPYAATPGVKNAKETFSVVQVGEDIQVIPTTGLNSLKKQVEDEYKQDMEQYKKDTKNSKNSRDVNTPKPVKKSVKILKSPFKSREDAQKYAEDKIQERDKGGAKKTTTENNKNW